MSQIQMILCVALAALLLISLLALVFGRRQ
jgi:hypothetical protein